jgi:hypothetical protein
MKTDKQANKQSGFVDGPNQKHVKVLPPELYEENRGFITITMNEFLISYLFKVYRAFDGDLLQALILGFMAHHNISRLSNQQKYDDTRIKDIITGSEKETLLTPCNAFSISQATGIPRETVRRKIAALIEKDWVKRDAKGQLFLTELLIVEFRDFNHELAEELLDVANQILNRCKKGSQSK